VGFISTNFIHLKVLRPAQARVVLREERGGAENRRRGNSAGGSDTAMQNSLGCSMLCLRSRSWGCYAQSRRPCCALCLDEDAVWQFPSPRAAQGSRTSSEYGLRGI